MTDPLNNFGYFVSGNAGYFYGNNRAANWWENIFLLTGPIDEIECIEYNLLSEIKLIMRLLCSI